jgi:hypothetical protein
LLFRSVKCLAEEIRRNNVIFYEEKVPDDIKERYEGRFSSFGLSKEKRADKMAEIIEDGLYLKKLLADDEEIDAYSFKQLLIMETIFSENIIVKKKEINDKVFIEVEEINRPKQSIFDPRDTSLNLGIKGKTSWVGSKCHIAETSVKGKKNFITGMFYQKANEGDQKIHDRFIAKNDKSGLKPKKNI